MQSCHYYWSEAIFVDLYHGLGEVIFRQRFRNFYPKPQYDDATDDCEDTDLNVCHILAVFKADVSDVMAIQVDEIVERWYTPLP